MQITCGIEWAEARHNVLVADDQRGMLGRIRVGACVAGFTAVVELIAEPGGSSQDTPVAIETDNTTCSWWR